MNRTLFLLIALTLCIGSASAAEPVFPNCLSGTKVGEWAMLMDTAGPKVGQRERFTVVEIKGEGEFETIVVRREIIDDNGDVGESREIELNKVRFEDRLRQLEDKATQVSRERMTVDNRELTLWSMAWEQDGHEYKVWASEDLPVGGFYKSWSSDPEFPASELIDSGY